MLAPWQSTKPQTFALVAGEVVVPSSVQWVALDAQGTTLGAYADAVARGGGVYEADTYANSGTPGRRTIVWRMQMTPSSPWITWNQAWETYRTATPFPVYAMISDLRDEGFTEAAFPTSRASTLLLLASTEVTKFTGRIFGARQQVRMADGAGGPILQFDEPVIAVEDLVIGAESSTSTETSEDRADFRVYNRHISEGTLMPDDRENPKLELRGGGQPGYRNAYGGCRAQFPRGQQNVRVSGIFGYTEPDGSPAGAVPLLIARATMLIAAQFSSKIAQPGTGVGDTTAWRTVEERTRDQSVRFGDIGATAGVRSGTTLRGAFTGDPVIDQILAMFVRGPRMGAA